MEKKAIRRIRELRARKMPWATIADTLNKEMITPPYTGERPARQWYRILVRRLGKLNDID